MSVTQPKVHYVELQGNFTATVFFVDGTSVVVEINSAPDVDGVRYCKLEARRKARAHFWKPKAPRAANDFAIENHGSLFLVRPLTDAAKAFLRDTAPEDAQFMGEAMAVEPRYLAGVCEAISEHGLTC